MPHYHVRVTKKSDRTSDALELDMSKDELMEQIVKPFTQGESFMCGGEPIDPFDVERIHINETEQPSSVLIPQIKAERSESEIVTMISDEWYVTKKGKNVTREFVKTPPKKKN